MGDARRWRKAQSYTYLSDLTSREQWEEYEKAIYGSLLVTRFFYEN